MIQKPIREIQKSDLDALLLGKEEESKTRDYKKGFSADHKIPDFLEDVCALANTAGGDLIIGISAKDGIPNAYTPIKAVPDAEILTLENAIRDGIEPRLAGTDIWPVEINPAEYVFIVRVQKSWNGPHRIKKSRRFMARSSRGNYEFDVAEIRNAVMSSEAVPERIRAFRAHQIAKVYSGGSPVQLTRGFPIILVHLLPLTAFSSAETIDLRDIVQTRDLPLFGLPDVRYRRNLDGILSFAPTNIGDNIAYGQIYRSGIIEAAIAIQLHGPNVFSVAYIEGYLPRGIKAFLDMMQRRGIAPPIYAFVTLLGFKGISVMWQSLYNETSSPLDREVADIPEIVIENPNVETGQLRPLLDGIWNAFGLERSPTTPIPTT